MDYSISFFLHKHIFLNIYQDLHEHKRTFNNERKKPERTRCRTSMPTLHRNDANHAKHTNTCVNTYKFHQQNKTVNNLPIELSPRGKSGCADMLPPTFVATLE